AHPLTTGTVPGDPLLSRVVPFNSQITVVPSPWLNHRRSVKPSPLKSPVVTVHAVEKGEIVPGEPPPITAVPFMNQSTASPVPILNQSMSPLRSRWTSRAPMTAHPRATVATEPPPITVEPLMNQISTAPVVPLRQRMSALPSPLKSRWPTMAHGLDDEPVEPPPITVAPCISQVTT